MSDLSERALDTAARNGATYADVRLVRRRAQHVDVKMGHVQAVALSETEGLGVRVLVDGAWGFASTSDLRGTEIDASPPSRRASHAHRRACPRARPARRAATRRRASTRPRSWRTRSSVPIDATVALLLEADAAMGAVAGVATTQATYHAFREWKTFASSAGSRTRQVVTHVGSNLEVNARPRRRAAAAHVPRVGRRLSRRRLRACPRAGPRDRAPGRSPKRPSSC